MAEHQPPAAYANVLLAITAPNNTAMLEVVESLRGVETIAETLGATITPVVIEAMTHQSQLAQGSLTELQTIDELVTLYRDLATR